MFSNITYHKVNWSGDCNIHPVTRHCMYFIPVKQNIRNIHKEKKIEIECKWQAQARGGKTISTLLYTTALYHIICITFFA